MYDNNAAIQNLDFQETINPDNTINKNRINALTGSVALPFVDTLWAMTGESENSISFLMNRLGEMLETHRENEMLKVLEIPFTVSGVQFPQKMQPLTQHAEAVNYFLFSFLLDMDKAIQDYTKNETK